VEDQGSIICIAHGETPATFACRHLAQGVACGFHSRLDDPGRWPDAWCDLCAESLQAAGGQWNDAFEQVAEISALCTECYEAARARNRNVPPHARGQKARLTSLEATHLVQHVMQTVRATQDAANLRWGLPTRSRWDFENEKSTLTLSGSFQVSVVADVRLVGSFSVQSSSFQWAWATYGDNSRQGRSITPLRVFGEVRGLRKLITDNWRCEEADAWEMTCLAAYLLGAEAVYCAPIDQLRWFMLLSHLRRVD
jgi:hypothetical protein